MVLVPVTADTVDAYVDFLKRNGDDDGRAYLTRIDIRPAVLERGTDSFWLLDGRPAAALTASRTPRRDGGEIVSLFIEPEGKRAVALAGCLADFLAAEPPTAPAPRLYRLSEPADMAMPAAELAAAGFAPKAGRHKYLRDPGPPRAGEFPGADAAVAAGYVTTDVTPAMIDAEPDLFARLADLFNRAFLGQPGLRRRDEATMKRVLLAGGGGFLVARKDGALTGYLAYTPMAAEILVGEYASLRRHWGTGSVDLMCRHVAALVAERWGLPIIGFADATNAPSCAAMERSGMRRVLTYTIWEREVAPGAPLDRAGEPERP